MSEAVVVFVCVGGNLYTFTAAGVQQTILIKDDLSQVNSFLKSESNCFAPVKPS